MNDRSAGSRSHPRALRILVLHQHYWPEIAATAQILSDLCEDLAAQGHEVSVLCGQPSYHADAGARRLPAAERRADVWVRRVWSYTPQQRSIPRRIAHYGSYFTTSLAAALTAPAPDVCFVMSTPPLLLGVTGCIMKAFRDVPFVYSVQDLYPDIAIHLGVLREGSLLANAIGAVSSLCYGQAAALATLSDGMAARLVAKGMVRNRIHVIPNWADTGSLSPVERDNAFARAHGLAEGFVVQYSGNLGLSQGLESALKAAVLLRSQPVKFAFVGAGSACAALVAESKRKQLDNVLFLPPQPRESLSDLLGSCDVGLVTMKRDVGDDLVPSKLYGIMAAARPVLATVAPESEVARVVQDADCGWLAAPESPDALADSVLLALRQHADIRRTMGARGRAACLEKYSRGVVTKRYGELFQRVVDDARGAGPG